MSTKISIQIDEDTASYISSSSDMSVSEMQTIYDGLLVSLTFPSQNILESRGSYWTSKLNHILNSDNTAVGKLHEIKNLLND